MDNSATNQFLQYSGFGDTLLSTFDTSEVLHQGNSGTCVIETADAAIASSQQLFQHTDLHVDAISVDSEAEAVVGPKLYFSASAPSPVPSTGSPQPSSSPLFLATQPLQGAMDSIPMETIADALGHAFGAVSSSVVPTIVVQRCPPTTNVLEWLSMHVNEANAMPEQSFSSNNLLSGINGLLRDVLHSDTVLHNIEDFLVQHETECDRALSVLAHQYPSSGFKINRQIKTLRDLLSEEPGSILPDRSLRAKVVMTLFSAVVAPVIEDDVVVDGADAADSADEGSVDGPIASISVSYGCFAVLVAMLALFAAPTTATLQSKLLSPSYYRQVVRSVRSKKRRDETSAAEPARLPVFTVFRSVCDKLCDNERTSLQKALAPHIVAHLRHAINGMHDLVRQLAMQQLLTSDLSMLNADSPRIREVAMVVVKHALDLRFRERPDYPADEMVADPNPPKAIPPHLEPAIRQYCKSKRGDIDRVLVGEAVSILTAGQQMFAFAADHLQRRGIGAGRTDVTRALVAYILARKQVEPLSEAERLPDDAFIGGIMVTEDADKDSLTSDVLPWTRYCECDIDMHSLTPGSVLLVRREPHRSGIDSVEVYLCA